MWACPFAYRYASQHTRFQVKFMRLDHSAFFFFRGRPRDGVTQTRKLLGIFNRIRSDRSGLMKAGNIQVDIFFFSTINRLTSSTASALSR